jgi:hypothetical protein
MTITIVSFTPKEILFASDTYRYFLKEGTVEDVLSHKLEINHTNLKDHVESFETNQPKIHKISKTCGLIAGGDGRFTDIIEGLNKRKNITNQILERLQQKGKITAFWSCHIGRFRKGKVELTSIIYESGKITTKEHSNEDVNFDSFAPEMQKRFPFMLFYMAKLQEKIKIINEFFAETTKLYNGMAGGIPQITIINEKGFQWITTQNFTGYSYNWMPEKIETISTTEVSWSSDTWTNILELGFECESKMICLMFATIDVRAVRASAGYASGLFQLTLDGTELPATLMNAGADPILLIDDNIDIHTIAIVDKGSHTFRMRMCAGTVNTTVYAFHRRLSILKGFYQGGTT